MSVSLKSINMHSVKMGQNGAGPTYFLLDTFSGPAGTLGSHTGEIGATWSDDGNSGNGESFADMMISGSNSAYLNYIGATPSVAGQQAAKTSSNPAPDLSNFYLEFTANINTSLITQDGGIMVYSSDGYANNDYGLNLFFGTSGVSGHPPSVYTLLVIFQGFTTTDSVSSPNITVTSGSHTLRAEVTNNRKTFNFFLDGVNVYSGTNPTSLPTLTSTGFWVNGMSLPDTNAQAVKMTRFAGGPL